MCIKYSSNFKPIFFCSTRLSSLCITKSDWIKSPDPVNGISGDCLHLGYDCVWLYTVDKCKHSDGYVCNKNTDFDHIVHSFQKSMSVNFIMIKWHLCGIRCSWMKFKWWGKLFLDDQNNGRVEQLLLPNYEMFFSGKTLCVIPFCHPLSVTFRFPLFFIPPNTPIKEEKENKTRNETKEGNTGKPRYCSPEQVMPFVAYGDTNPIFPIPQRACLQL